MENQELDTQGVSTGVEAGGNEGQVETGQENQGRSLDDDLSNLWDNDNSNETQPADGAETPTEPTEEVVDWTKDGRYGKMWKDPNDLFKSYRNAETQLNEYGAFKKNYEEIRNTFESRGLEVEKLNDYIEEYNQLKDPNNPERQDLDLLYGYLNNPQYSEQVASFFQNLRVSELQALYPNMNQAQIQKQMELEKEVNELKSFRQKEVQQKQEQEYYAKQEKAVGDIKSYAEGRGFMPNTEQIAQFIKDTSQKGVSVENLLPHFIYSFGKELDEAYNKKMEESYLKRLAKNHKATIPNPTASKTTTTKSSFENDLMSVL